MQYISSFYWQQEKTPQTSLVLQQLVFRRGKVPVLFACICEGEGGQSRINRYAAEQLLFQFRAGIRYFVKQYRSGERKLFEKIETLFRCRIIETEREAKAYCNRQGITENRINLAVLLCIGNCFWLFRKGKMKVLLFNTRFGRSYCEELLREQPEEQLETLHGVMEPDIGILLATEGMVAELTESERKDCLAAQEIRAFESAKRRLEELGMIAEERGGRQMGAVLFLTK